MSVLEEDQKAVHADESAEAAEISAAEAAAEGAAPDRAADVAKSNPYLDFACLTLPALALRLWFNFAGGHPNAWASADASEYIRYTATLAGLVSGAIPAGDFALSLKEFVITGPSLPVFLLGASLLSGKPFDPADSSVPLIAQSLVSACTAGLIYLISRKLFDRPTALIAGGIAVLYPAFIVNSGRLYSETLATFIECAALLLMVRGFEKQPTVKLVAGNIMLGISLIALQLSRSAMMLLTASALPIVFLQGLLLYGDKAAGQRLNWKKAALATGAMLIGAALTLAPWFVFEKAAYGKMTFVVDRVGHYNLFVGTNTDTQGFLSYPYPDGRGIEEQSFLTLIKQAYKKSPSRFWRLALDKPARLFKAPWNDYRAAIGPFDYRLQVAFHQVVLMLAILGVLVAAAVDPVKMTTAKLWGRASLLIAFALNLPYLLFITVPRYNETAIPVLIVFAAAGLTTLVSLNRNNPLLKAPKALLFALLAIFIFVRDDLKDPFTIGQAQTASIVAIGADNLSKGLISVAFGIAFFVAVGFSLSLLKGYKKVAAAGTVILALVALPLLFFQQRANGRPYESLVTFARPGEAIVGSIKLPEDAALTKNNQWYLLVDCADPTLFNRDVELTVNGKRLTGPFMPGISALDDWTYLKTAGGGKSAYLECEYIFDCMTQPAACTNLDLRQWFYLPLPADLVSEARQRKALNLTLKNTKTGATTLYGTSPFRSEKHRSEADTVLLPSRDLYSWEKCFYGVENDAGLTDTRYDEKDASRQADWHINFEKTSESLNGLDLNIRLWCQPQQAAGSQGEMAQATGNKDVSLNLDGQAAREGAITTGVTLLRAALAASPEKTPTQNASPKIVSPKTAPSLTLKWLDEKGQTVAMRLPWWKNSPEQLDIAIPCDLSKIAGKQITLSAHSDDPRRKITLSATTLSEHPVFGQGKFF